MSYFSSLISTFYGYKLTTQLWVSSDRTEIPIDSAEDTFPPPVKCNRPTLTWTIPFRTRRCRNYHQCRCGMDTMYSTDLYIASYWIQNRILGLEELRVHSLSHGVIWADSRDRFINLKQIVNEVCRCETSSKWHPTEEVSLVSLTYFPHRRAFHLIQWRFSDWKWGLLSERPTIRWYLAWREVVSCDSTCLRTRRKYLRIVIPTSKNWTKDRHRQFYNPSNRSNEKG